MSIIYLLFFFYIKCNLTANALPIYLLFGPIEEIVMNTCENNDPDFNDVNSEDPLAERDKNDKP